MLQSEVELLHSAERVKFLGVRLRVVPASYLHAPFVITRASCIRQESFQWTAKQSDDNRSMNAAAVMPRGLCSRKQAWAEQSCNHLLLDAVVAPLPLICHGLLEACISSLCYFKFVMSSCILQGRAAHAPLYFHKLLILLSDRSWRVLNSSSATNGRESGVCRPAYLWRASGLHCFFL